MTLLDVQVGTLDGTLTSLAALEGRATLLVVLGAGERTSAALAGWQALHVSVRGRGGTLFGVPTDAFGDLGGNAALERRLAPLSFPLTATTPLESPPDTDVPAGYSAPDPAQVFVRLRKALPDLAVDEGTAVLLDIAGEPVRWWPGSAGPSDPSLVAALEEALPVIAPVAPRRRPRPRPSRPTAS